MELKEQKAITRLQEFVAEVNKEDTFLGGESPEMVTLFVSFDIVNSTLYKSLHKDGWSTAFSNILRRIISVFSNNPTGGYDFWKTLGDEIIYTRKIGNEQDLLNTLEEIYRSLILLNQKIAQGELCDSKTAKILSIKATTWLADLSSSHEKTDNILTYYQINDKRRQADYIGPDIDAGFRTAHYSMSNRMIVSFEIACILMRYQHQLEQEAGFMEIPQRIHLLAHKVLKGVWDGHPYPILLYHGNPNQSFVDSLTPQDKESPSVLQEYWDSRFAREIELESGYLCYQEQVLEKLCQDLRLEKKIQRIMDLMERTGRVSTLDVKVLKWRRYTAVCYHIENQTLQFMIAKNRDTGLWGFGQVCFFYNPQFVEQTEQAYGEELGVDISIQNDPHYYARIPQLVSVTQFTEDKSTYKSQSVFLGRLNQLPTVTQTAGYAEIKLLRMEDMAVFQGECEPMFHETLAQCAEKILSMELEKKAVRIPN